VRRVGSEAAFTFRRPVKLVEPLIERQRHLLQLIFSAVGRYPGGKVAGGHRGCHAADSRDRREHPAGEKPAAHERQRQRCCASGGHRAAERQHGTPGIVQIPTHQNRHTLRSATRELPPLPRGCRCRTHRGRPLDTDVGSVDQLAPVVPDGILHPNRAIDEFRIRVLGGEIEVEAIGAGWMECTDNGDRVGS